MRCDLNYAKRANGENSRDYSYYELTIESPRLSSAFALTSDRFLLRQRVRPQLEVHRERLGPFAVLH